MIEYKFKDWVYENRHAYGEYRLLSRVQKIRVLMLFREQLEFDEKMQSEGQFVNYIKNILDDR